MTGTGLGRNRTRLTGPVLSFSLSWFLDSLLKIVGIVIHLPPKSSEPLVNTGVSRSGRHLFLFHHLPPVKTSTEPRSPRRTPVFKFLTNHGLRDFGDYSSSISIPKCGLFRIAAAKAAIPFCPFRVRIRVIHHLWL